MVGFNHLPNEGGKYHVLGFWWTGVTWCFWLNALVLGQGHVLHIVVYIWTVHMGCKHVLYTCLQYMVTTIALCNIYFVFATKTVSYKRLVEAFDPPVRNSGCYWAEYSREYSCCCTLSWTLLYCTVPACRSVANPSQNCVYL